MSVYFVEVWGGGQTVTLLISTTHSSIASSSVIIILSDLRNFWRRQKLSSLLARSSQLVSNVLMFTFSFVAIL